MGRRSGGWMRCGVSLGSSSEVRREGQTFAGESLLVRYANFVKLPHTIFALPFALLGVVVASYRAAVTWRTLGLAVLAFTCARFVALGFNRIADRALDARNPRTRARELPSGRLTLGQAWAAVVVAAALFLWAAWALNPLCFALAPVALVFISGYSYAKRFTHWSHLWLGLADGIAVVAVAGRGPRRHVLGRRVRRVLRAAGRGFRPRGAAQVSRRAAGAGPGDFRRQAAARTRARGARPVRAGRGVGRRLLRGGGDWRGAHRLGTPARAARRSVTPRRGVFYRQRDRECGRASRRDRGSGAVKKRRGEWGV